MIFTTLRCPLCEGSVPLGVLRTTEPGRLVLECAECCRLWVDPKDVTAESAVTGKGPSMTVKPHGFRLLFGRRGRATRENVEAAGWGELIESEE